MGVVLKPGDRFTIAGDAKFLDSFKRMGFTIRDGVAHGVIGQVVCSDGESHKVQKPPR